MRGCGCPRAARGRSRRRLIWPGWPRSSWMRGSNGVSLPMAASTAMAPATTAAAKRFSAAKRPMQRQRGRDLRAVEQRQSFLGAEREGREPRDLESPRARAAISPLWRTLPQPEQHRGHVGERGEIARGADGALRRNARIHARVEQRHHRIDHLGSHARVAAREARDLEQHREAHRGIVEQRAHAHAVREHEVALQQLQLVVGDVRLGELAEARVDAVDGLAFAPRCARRRARPRRACRASPHRAATALGTARTSGGRLG